MAKKIAFFTHEQAVIDAIQKLEQAGFVAGELKVLAKDGEHTRRVEAESDLHVDEMNALINADNAANEWANAMLSVPPAVFSTVGGGFWGSSVAVPGIMAGAFSLGGDEREEALRSYGLDDDETQACLTALQEGKIALIAETDESKSVLDQDSGPDISRLGVAEGVFRGCGASSIISGS